MSLRTDMRADVATIMSDDGETVTITTQSGPVSVSGFWRDLGIDGDAQVGPHFTLATDDKPVDLANRDTVSRAGDSDVYTVVHIQPSHAGQYRLTLQANY